MKKLILKLKVFLLVLLTLSSTSYAQPTEQNAHMLCNMITDYVDYKKGISTDSNSELKIIFEGLAPDPHYQLQDDLISFWKLDSEIKKLIQNNFSHTDSCNSFSQSYFLNSKDIYNYLSLFKIGVEEKENILIKARLKAQIYFSLLQLKILKDNQDGLADEQVHLLKTQSCVSSNEIRLLLLSLFDQQVQLLMKAYINIFGISSYQESYTLLQELADLQLKKAQRQMYTEPAKIFAVSVASILIWEIAVARVAMIPTVARVGSSLPTLKRMGLYAVSAGSGAYMGLQAYKEDLKDKMLSPREIKNILLTINEFSDLELNSPKEYNELLEVLTKEENKPSNYIIETLSKVNSTVGLEKAAMNCEVRGFN